MLGLKASANAVPPDASAQEELVPFTSRGITNLYSKSTPDPKYLEYLKKLYEILAPNLSLGDAKHDFEFNQGNLDDPKFKQGFNYGIPNPSTQILDEAKALTSVIEKYVNKYNIIRPNDQFKNLIFLA
jgi:hypothetical protein